MFIGNRKIILLFPVSYSDVYFSGEFVLHFVIDKFNRNILYFAIKATSL